jgi:phage virion morphogenesis protein
MASAVEIKLGEIDRLARKLNSFVLSGGDTTRLMDSLGMVIEEQTKERFDTETDPQGDPWHKLTKRYIKRKMEGDKNYSGSTGGILVRGGLMRMSIESQVTGSDTVLVGSPMEYADFHQNARSHWRRREFLGLSTDNIAELQDAVEIFMKGHIA